MASGGKLIETRANNMGLGAGEKKLEAGRSLAPVSSRLFFVRSSPEFEPKSSRPPCGEARVLAIIPDLLLTENKLGRGCFLNLISYFKLRLSLRRTESEMYP